MRILAIDPGPSESGVVIWQDGVVDAFIRPNVEIRSRMKARTYGSPDLCAIEMIASYGMPVGKDVFHTCIWIGRFMECAKLPINLVYRKDVKLHLCGTPRAKDANIRQALIDKYGPVGVKKNPGKLYGISGHLWAAVAVADFAECEHLKGEQAA